MPYQFENSFYSIIGNVIRLMKAQPLNLGGYAASGGGAGGPPGGYIGWLPQTRVSYDYSELAVNTIPESGASLLDNLNRIRYRIEDIEAGQASGVRVSEDGVLVLSGVHTLDFLDRFDIEIIDSDTVSVSLLTSGVVSDTTYSGVYGEDLTSQIGGTAHFDISGTAYDNSLAVYFNGVRQRQLEYELDPDFSGFTLAFTPIAGDTLHVDYVVAFSGSAHTHNQYALADDVYTKEEIATLLDMHSRTVNQQIVFTIVGSGTIVSGVMPLRIYAHDVNDEATITEVFVAFNTAPSDEVRVNVLKNGYTIFDSPSYVSIPASNYTASKTTGFGTDTFIKDDYFQIKIEKGNTTARDMTVHLRFSYVLD